MFLEKGRGKVVAVCLSPEHGYPTFPQNHIAVGMLGIEGNAHSGPLRESFTKPGTLKPNDRPISIVSNEIRIEMNRRFGLNIQPGGFNEQILVEDLGDLSDVNIGSHLVFDSGVELEVTDVAFPCDRLTAFHNESRLMEALKIMKEGAKARSRRGILAKVLGTGEIRPNYNVTLFQFSTSITK